jgi:hypothetical protein
MCGGEFATETVKNGSTRLYCARCGAGISGDFPWIRENEQLRKALEMSFDVMSEYLDKVVASDGSSPLIPAWKAAREALKGAK